MDHSTDQDFGYLQIFNILVRRGLWVVGGFGLSLLAALIFTLAKEPTYRSSMQLIIEPNFEEDFDPANTSAEPSERQREVNYATQINLMRSDELLQRAIDALRADYPDLDIGGIKESLTLSRVQEGGTVTRIVSVSYVDTDPVRAERVLSSLQSVYQAYSLERQEQRLNRGLTAINSQFEEARRSLARSQSDLKAFRQDQNIIDPQRQATAVTDSLNQVLAEQLVLNAQYEEALAQYDTIRSQVELAPSSAFAAARLSQSSRYQSLLDALQEVELALAERQVIYTVEDAGVESLIAQRQNQLGLLRQEAERVLGSSAIAGDFAGQIQGTGQLTDLDLDLVKSLAEAETVLDGLAARQNSLLAAEQSLQAELNQFPTLIDSYDRLEPEVETQQAVLQQLLTQRELLSAQLARGGFSWQVVATPQLGYQVGPDHKTNLLLGAAIGLVLGSFAAFAREALDGVVRTPEDLETQTLLPILGTLPVLDRLPIHIHEYVNESHELGSAQMTATPMSLEASATTDTAQFHHPYEALQEETYWRALRDPLDFAFRTVQFYRSVPTGAIAVSALLPTETSSVLALGLALSAARSGQRAIVVDANFRASVIQQWLNSTNVEGLSRSMATGTNPVPITVSLLGAQIDVLPAGEASSDPMTLLTSQYFRTLIQTLEKQYDLVIVDSPSVMGAADALEVASCCAHLVLTAELNSLTRAELKKALSVLNQVDVIGIVASGADSQLFNQDPHSEPMLGHSASARKLSVNSTS